MSTDVKIFAACDHVVDGKYYDATICPRCYSKGYYFDVSFDAGGEIITTTGSLKLQQEILKILIDHKYENVFHPLWGSEMYTIIGHKNLAVTQARLEIIVRKTIEYLQAIQNTEYNNGKLLTPDEILGSIDYIEISALGLTGWQVYVQGTNTVGQIFTQVATF